ncbi:hypothetical protein P43SY_000630 [Pythium insidiosum]|uniref:Ribosome assembly factor mrt4 n=1 Tax=Pythium insidiosum TaxID=114742 RepID=A0AAD5Q6P4_PYTIN|nr:hypothetical protein P43SY_000630 [Pythium insidiosum]
MPRSRRQRVKPLTNTNKKGTELKQKMVEAIRDAIDSYKSAYAFSFQNMRTNHFKDVRLEFRDSRFFLGKNKVMKVALGRSAEEEYAEELSKLAGDVNGNVGLLFTNRPRDEVLAYFEQLSIKDFPRSGFVATEQVDVPAGPLPPQFIGSMVESLRTLGLPVDLKKGVVVLNQKHTICKAGQTLTPEQAKLLTHFERKMAEFKLTILSVWTEGAYERLADESVTGGNGDEDMDDDDEDM